MCGRFALNADLDSIRRRTRADRVDNTNNASSRFRKSYNIGPTRYAPVVISERPAGGSSSSASSSSTSSSSSGTKVIKFMKWGLIPNWSTDASYSATRNTINARDDTVSSGKSMWTSMRDKKRCIVPIEGFFEWQRLGENEKIKLPHYVAPALEGSEASESKEGSSSTSDPPLLLCAGLYDIARLPEKVKDETTGEYRETGEQTDVWSFTIITTENSKQIEFLHDRMPVILDRQEDIDLWLDPSIPFEKVRHLLRPKETGLRVYAVTSFVNKVGADHDGEECIRPATEEEIRIMRLGKGALGAEKGLQSVASFFGKKAAPSGPVVAKEETGSKSEGSSSGSATTLPSAEPTESSSKGKKRALVQTDEEEDEVKVVEPAHPSTSSKPPPQTPKPKSTSTTSKPTTPGAKKPKSAASSPASRAKSPDPKQRSLTSFFGKK